MTKYIRTSARHLYHLFHAVELDQFSARYNLCYLEIVDRYI